MNIKQKTYLISALFMVLIIILALGVIKPLMLEIEKASATAEESREKLLLLEKTDQDYLKQVESDYKEINDNLGLIKSGLIDSEEAVDFFMALEGVAYFVSNRLEIKATEFPSITLNLMGSFPNLMRFSDWLESGKYFLDIDSIQVRRISEGETIEGLSAGDVKSTIKIKLYTK